MQSSLPPSFCLIYPLWSEGACTFVGNLMVQRNGVGDVAEKYLPNYYLQKICGIRNVKNAKSPYPTPITPAFGIYSVHLPKENEKISLLTS